MPAAQPHRFSRRDFVRLAAVGAASGLGAWALTACAPGAPGRGTVLPPATPDYVLAHDPEVAAAEARRASSGRTVHHLLSAEVGMLAIAPGQFVGTWGYREDAALAALGPTITATRGDRLRVGLANQLPEETSVHWHGLRIRNDMDGAPPDTQAPIGPGAQFAYDFTLPDHGTYWYHSHSGVQADRAMFGALIVEDPADASGADVDVVVVIDDWLDGFETSPAEVLTALGVSGGAHAGHGGVSAHGADANAEAGAAARALVAAGNGDSTLLGGPSQHIAYPLHLIGGRSPDDPARYEVPSGARVRLRIINAAAETPYRVALAGHALTVIAADGWDTEPHECDAVFIAPAQRIDVTVDIASGVWPLVASVEGRPGAALATIATADAQGTTPTGAAATNIPELSGRLAFDTLLRPAQQAVLPERDPDQLWRLELIELPDSFVWGIGGPDAAEMRPREGERIRIELTNNTRMWHPMHLHGHTFASRHHGGLRRDTIAVLPGETAVLDFDADNPGRWMIHCHNAYHFAAGMSAPIRYVR